MSQPPASPADAHLREETISSQPVFEGKLLQVRCDRIRLPDGAQATREFIVHPGAVMVVPLLDDGRLLMERQYRYPLGRVILEFPAGKLEPGESVAVCAQRELLEETGYSATHWARACLVHNACAYSTEGIEIWFARGLQAGPRQLDDGELINLCMLTEPELDALAASGEVTDVKTLIGLQWLQKWRAGQWSLDWLPHR